MATHEPQYLSVELVTDENFDPTVGLTYVTNDLCAHAPRVPRWVLINDKGRAGRPDTNESGQVGRARGL